MGIYLELKKTINEVYINGDYKKILGQKYEGDDFKNWQVKIKDQIVRDQVIHSDTTGFNPSYTAFIDFKEKQNTSFFKAAYLFYLRKSILGDYVTCYGIIRTTLVYHKDDRIKYPDMFIVSPVGPFQGYFKEGWKLLNKLYPNSTYVNYYQLSRKIDEFTLPGEKESTIYDLIFGQYGENPKIASGDKYYDPSDLRPPRFIAI
jgi:hypothetical protein